MDKLEDAVMLTLTFLQLREHPVPKHPRVAEGRSVEQKHFIQVKTQMMLMIWYELNYCKNHLYFIYSIQDRPVVGLAVTDTLSKIPQVSPAVFHSLKRGDRLLNAIKHITHFHWKTKRWSWVWERVKIKRSQILNYGLNYVTIAQ